MNKFIILWSLISPVCLGLIGSVLWFYQMNWHPGYPDIWMSIAIYLVYWFLLAILQGGALLWKFQDQQLAYRWFFTTCIVGFLIMLLHDLSLALLGIDTRGQGVLILILSLPCLAVFGGLILGLAQFLLVRNHYRTNRRLNYLNILWFVISVLAWSIATAGIFLGNNMWPMLIFLFAFGTLMKGWFIQKHLRRQTQHQ